ncbi:MAG TPA: hypothetical protein VJ860_20220 [Polyangia bacterium]|jgi:hypothetical protein|nr:hypothetical protein [Polyangia bacterium]
MPAAPLRALPKVGEPVDIVFLGGFTERHTVAIRDDSPVGFGVAALKFRISRWYPHEENKIPGWRRVTERTPAHDQAPYFGGGEFVENACPTAGCVGHDVRGGNCFATLTPPTSAKPEPSERERGALELRNIFRTHPPFALEPRDSLDGDDGNDWLAVYDRAAAMFKAKADERVQRAYDETSAACDEMDRFRKERDVARAEVERLTKERDWQTQEITALNHCLQVTRARIDELKANAAEQAADMVRMVEDYEKREKELVEALKKSCSREPGA